MLSCYLIVLVEIMNSCVSSIFLLMAVTSVVTSCRFRGTRDRCSSKLVFSESPNGRRLLNGTVSFTYCCYNTERSAWVSGGGG